MPEQNIALAAHQVSSGYGPIRVLWDVDVQVPAGSAVLLLGPNGAGKSTLLRCIAGLIPLWSGEVVLFGESVGQWAPDRRVASSMAYTSETGIFPQLSVEDNLRIGGYGLGRREVRAALERTWEEFPLIAGRRKSPADSLSGGQRKLLALAKAMMRRPRLLVMDEPSSGLSPLLVKSMVEALASVRETHNITLLLAEQNAKFLDIADNVCILSGGRVGFKGSVEEFRSRPEVVTEFFGMPVTGKLPGQPASRDQPPDQGEGHATGLAGRG